jgi:hypothetical protein
MARRTPSGEAVAVGATRIRRRRYVVKSFATLFAAATPVR